MLTFEQKVNEIPSLFTKRHAHIIHGLIRWLRPENVLEVGAYAGYMTAWMAQALEENDYGIVTAIDNYSLGTGMEMIHNNLVALGLANRVFLLDDDSMKMEFFPICDFAFIDGNHGYEGVSSDVNKAIKAGATCIVLHDSTSWWGVNKFVNEYQLESFNQISVPFDEGLTVYLAKHPIYPPQYTEERFPKGYVE